MPVFDVKITVLEAKPLTTYYFTNSGLTINAIHVHEYTVTRVSRQLFFRNLESKQIRKLRPVYGPRKGITSRAINVGHRENITWSVYTCPND
ncbi:hypothetical protein ALC53_02879 [Atta colombica]|uniref:Uncharacterized protein n=1 Tax=Atta colombica TaxID=520822 RepID=A0A195BR08_9HYME|nr:hypothetical protein ALC53_02879 [Atta colombica]